MILKEQIIFYSNLQKYIKRFALKKKNQFLENNDEIQNICKKLKEDVHNWINKSECNKEMLCFLRGLFHFLQLNYNKCMSLKDKINEWCCVNLQNNKKNNKNYFNYFFSKIKNIFYEQKDSGMLKIKKIINNDRSINNLKDLKTKEIKMKSNFSKFWYNILMMEYEKCVEFVSNKNILGNNQIFLFDDIFIKYDLLNFTDQNNENMEKKAGINNLIESTIIIVLLIFTNIDFNNKNKNFLFINCENIGLNLLKSEKLLSLKYFVFSKNIQKCFDKSFNLFVKNTKKDELFYLEKYSKYYTSYNLNCNVLINYTRNLLKIEEYEKLYQISKFLPVNFTCKFLKFYIKKLENKQFYDFEKLKIFEKRNNRNDFKDVIEFYKIITKICKTKRIKKKEIKIIVKFLKSVDCTCIYKTKTNEDRNYFINCNKTKIKNLENISSYFKFIRSDTTRIYEEDILQNYNKLFDNESCPIIISCYIIYYCYMNNFKIFSENKIYKKVNIYMSKLIIILDSHIEWIQ